MSIADESSPDTGPMLPGFETLETATEQEDVLWPTPAAADSERASHTYMRGNPTLLGAALHPSISSAADFPVNQFLTPASARATPTNAGSGPSSYESYARLDPAGRWLRMYQDSFQSTLDGSLEECSGTWPRAGTMRNGTSYRRLTSERRTSGRGSSSLPTPKERDWKNATGQEQRDSPDLNVVAKWPTPKGSPDKMGRPRPNDRGDLQAAVQFTTPVADDTGHRKNQYSQGGTALSMQVNGQLNADWVSLLMGFPADWCVVDGSAESRE